MPATGSRIPNLGSSKWILIASYTDSNAANIFDYDTGVLPTTYDMYNFVCTYEDASGVSNNLNIRVNNISTATYNTFHASLPATGVTEWKCFVTNGWGNRDYFVEAIIRGTALNAGTKNPTFGIVSTGAHYSWGVSWHTPMVGGFQSDNVATINRIRIFSVGNATGRIKLFGMNY